MMGDNGGGVYTVEFESATTCLFGVLLYSIKQGKRDGDRVERECGEGWAPGGEGMGNGRWGLGGEGVERECGEGMGSK